MLGIKSGNEKWIDSKTVNGHKIGKTSNPSITLLPLHVIFDQVTMNAVTGIKKKMSNEVTGEEGRRRRRIDLDTKEGNIVENGKEMEKNGKRVIKEEEEEKVSATSAATGDQK